MAEFPGSVEFTNGYDCYTLVVDKAYPFRLGVLTLFEFDGGHAYPWQLCIDAFATIVDEFSVSSVTCTYGQAEVQPSELISWDDLIRARDAKALNEQNESFPDAIVFNIGQESFLKIHTEFWNHHGGPGPYHDTTTLSVLCKDSAPLDRVKKIVSDAAFELNITAEDAMSVAECKIIERAASVNEKLNMATYLLAPITLIGVVVAGSPFLTSIDFDVLRYVFFGLFPYLQFEIVKSNFTNICVGAIILNGPINAGLFYFACKWRPHYYPRASKFLASTAVVTSLLYAVILTYLGCRY